MKNISVIGGLSQIRMDGDNMNFEEIIRQLTSVGIAMTGGVVSILNAKNTKITLTTAIKRIVISGFTGWMMFFLICDVTTGFLGHESTKSFIIGMSGYTGVYTLEYLESLFNKILKVTKK